MYIIDNKDENIRNTNSSIVYDTWLHNPTENKAVVGGPADPAMAWPLFLPRKFFFTIICY